MELEALNLIPFSRRRRLPADRHLWFGDWIIDDVEDSIDF